MAEAKKYTLEQLENADKLMQALAKMPEDQQRTVVATTNCFIAGYEARATAEKIATA